MQKLFSKTLKYKVKKGFTLIETLVAITVLMLAVTGPLVISQKGLSAAGYAKDQMIAYYLAQDAMEYVRNVRDAKISAGIVGVGVDWLSIASGEVLSNCNDSDCFIETRPALDGNAQICASACVMNKNASGDEFLGYGYATGAPTIFTRKVRIEKPNGDPLVNADLEARVTVTVSWPTFSGQKNITLVENLFKQI
jgi:prepilin-type N-terminal cleavage/methylation domain-containing protein